MNTANVIFCCIKSFTSGVSGIVLWTTSSYLCLSILYLTFSFLLRLELGVLGTYIFKDGSQNNFYRAVTAHGLGMVFLFIMPGLISAVGNTQLPAMFNCLDFATPRLNNFAFWLSVLAVQTLVVGMSCDAGLSAGWTLYFPLTGIDFSSSHAVSIAIIALHILGLSSEAGSITFMVSLQIIRSSGITSLKWDLISWAIFVVSVLLLTTLPVLGSGITILFFERNLNFSGFYGISTDSAGDPVAFQHLFWFFGHPEVYVIILPAFAVISGTFEKLRLKATASYLGMVLAIWSIGIVGYFVWAHHMFTVGMADSTRLYFSAATLVIGVPTAVKIFAWSLGFSETSFRTVEYLLGVTFVSCFVFGGFTGLVLSNAAIDFAYHDTYFVVGHFHYVLSIAAAIGLTLFVIETAEQILFSLADHSTIMVTMLIAIIAVNTLFLLQHVIGIEGHPRRVYFSPELYVGYAAFSNVGIFGLLIAFSRFMISFTPSSASTVRVPQVL